MLIYLWGFMSYTTIIHVLDGGVRYAERKPGGAYEKPMTIRRLLYTFQQMEGKKTSMSWAWAHSHGQVLKALNYLGIIHYYDEAEMTQTAFLKSLIICRMGKKIFNFHFDTYRLVKCFRLST